MEIAHIVNLTRHGGVGELIGINEIAPPQIHRVHAQLTRRVIHGAFQRINRLRPARAAIGIDLRGVGVDAAVAEPSGLHVVDPHQHFGGQIGLNKLRKPGVVSAHI